MIRAGRLQTGQHQRCQLVHFLCHLRQATMDCPKLALLSALIFSHYSVLFALKGFKGSDQGLCNKNVQIPQTRLSYKVETIRYCTHKVRNTCLRYGRHKQTVPYIQTYQKEKMMEVCCEGYIENDGECQPTCIMKCIHGYCSGVNVCTCDNGYHLSPDNFTCNPTCSEECINSKCVSPDICHCDNGYKKDPTDSYRCRPFCSKECKNGECIGPESCSCFEGYQKHITMNGLTCKPICQDTCVHADCTAPNICTCNEGFVKFENATNICVPHCSKGCLNGVCAAPEICTCYEGYQKSKDPEKCEPVCYQGCVNAECTAPEICTCWKGYRQTNLKNPHVCDPICSQPCINSKCNAPEICVCDEGYIHADDNDPYSCSPHCADACVNSNCTKPGECECFTGYEKNANQSNMCDPICSDGCENGDCVEPEVCSCWEGYITSDDLNICQPVCSSCTNGLCSAPETCDCLSGYENPSESNATCIPICTKTCINSTCSAPDSCTCNDGFVKLSDHDNECSPHCSEGCVHATCTAPEVCECLPGYQTSSSSQGLCVPVCTDRCVNGVCIAPEKCICFWGYELFSKKCIYRNDFQTECFFKVIGDINHSEHKSSQDELKFTLQECMFLKLLIMKHALLEKDQTIPQIILQLNCSIDLNNNKSSGSLNVNCDLLSVNSQTIKIISSNTEESLMSSIYTDTFTTKTITDETNQYSHTNELPDLVKLGEKVHDLPYNDHEMNSKEETTTEIVNLSLLYFLDTYGIHKPLLNYESPSVPEQNKGEHPNCVNHSGNVAIKNDNSLFIAEKMITADYFDDIQSSNTENDWCICSQNLFKKNCSITMNVDFYVCSCSENIIIKETDDDTVLASWITEQNPLVLSVFLVLVVTFCIAFSIYIIARCYQSRHYHIGELEDGNGVVQNENAAFMKEVLLQEDDEPTEIIL